MRKSILAIATLLFSTLPAHAGEVPDHAALSTLVGANINLHHLALTLGADSRTTDQGLWGPTCFFTDDAAYYLEGEGPRTPTRTEVQYDQESWHVVDFTATATAGGRLEVLSVTEELHAKRGTPTNFAFICATPFSNFSSPTRVEVLRDSFHYRLWLTR